MPRRSAIARLPKEIRDKCEGLLRDGATIDEIHAALDALGVRIGRSSVGRWKANAESAMARYRDVQALGDVWAKSLKDDPEGKVGRLLIEVGKTNVLDYMLQRAEPSEDGETTPLDPKEVYFLSAAAKNFESAGKINIDRELRIRVEVAKETARKAANEAEAFVKSKGLSGDAAREIRAKILGVAA